MKTQKKMANLINLEREYEKVIVCQCEFPEKNANLLMKYKILTGDISEIENL